MSGQHTPGPWRIERQNPSPTTGVWMIAGEKPGYLAEVRDCGSGDVEANARLIAAAPDLLDALEELANGYKGNRWDVGLVPRIKKARAAIAKVTTPAGTGPATGS